MGTAAVSKPVSGLVSTAAIRLPSFPVALWMAYLTYRCGGSVGFSPTSRTLEVRLVYQWREGFV